VQNSGANDRNGVDLTPSPVGIGTGGIGKGFGCRRGASDWPGVEGRRPKASEEGSRVPPALQLPQVFRAVIGREMRRTRIGGIAIKCTIAAFG
jgi:hypothetical protein